LAEPVEATPGPSLTWDGPGGNSALVNIPLVSRDAGAGKLGG